MKLVDEIEKGAKEIIIGKIVDLLDKDPVKNGERIFSLIKKISKDDAAQEMVETVYNMYKNSPTLYAYIQDILKSGNKNCLKKLFQNFFGNAVWYGVPKRDKYLNEDDTKIPFTILISPSMRCNLSCTGCYAAQYDKKDDIPFEEVDRIVGEARALGIYFIVILGGEPFFNEYMLDIYKKYTDVLFMPFTNGTLFNEKLADTIKNLSNVIPMLSLEGFEAETDLRRGKGTFNLVMKAMDLLKERGVLFGVSSATSTTNMEVVSSDAFIDMLIEKGSKMSWYFIYMPVGTGVDLSAMLTPKQRIELGKNVRHIRTEKPYFAIDFFNDAPFVGGCISGKYYCHINAKEEVEPCIFAHFACDNLKNKPLVDIFRSDFFRTLRSRQPYNDNMLLPCMMIDNPKIIRDIVKETGAHPTDESGKRMISDIEFMKDLDKLAADFAPYADKSWEEDFHKKGNTDMARG